MKRENFPEAKSVIESLDKVDRDLVQVEKFMDIPSGVASSVIVKLYNDDSGVLISSVEFTGDGASLISEQTRVILKEKKKILENKLESL